MNLSQRKISLIFSAVAFAAAALAVLVNGAPKDFFVDDTKFQEEIRAAASRHKIPEQLVRALIFQESRFDDRTRGRKGEIGLMQILPSGAVADWARIHKVAEPGEDELFDPRMNLEIGCWFLGRALRRWSGYKDAIPLALAHYNAGESRANRWKPDSEDGELLPRITIASTRRYIVQIMKRYRKYTR